MNLKNKISFIFLLVIANLLFFSSPAQTQAAARILINWQAQSFAPAGYQGKILPSPGTNVKLGLELVKDGKIQDLSKASIFWYLDEKLLTKGQGLKEINFIVSRGATYSHFVRTTVEFKNQFFENSVDIPVVSPEVIIKTPLPAENFIPLGKNIFQAIPYFFDATNLQEIIFSWTINNQNIKSSDFLELEIVPPVPLGRNFNIMVAAQSLKNTLEFGVKEINLNVRQ